MAKKLLLIVSILYTTITYAGTIKTDVVVIGNGAGAAAAAIQSARSKLKTVLLVKGDWLEDSKQKQIIADQYFNRPFHKSDSISFFNLQPPSNVRLSKEGMVALAVSDLKKRADTIKLLSIKLRAVYTEVEKDGTGWKVTVTIDGIKTTIKAKALIDATEKAEVVTKVGATIPTAFNDRRKTAGQYLYRTAIAGGISQEKLNEVNNAYPQVPAFYIPLSAVVVKDASNLFVVDKALAVDGDQYLPAQVSLGEGVGAAAAYCAFTTTTTKNLNVRAIQIELLDFGTYLFPFVDVKTDDPYYRSIQQIAATGMLKGSASRGEGEPSLLFMPDEIVKTEEIKPVLTEIYSRAFLWLAREKPGEHFTTANLLSLISEITLAEPKDFKINTQRAWKTEYKFTSDFDLERPVTRREFAVLANKYLNPFARAVDMQGRIVN